MESAVYVEGNANEPIENPRVAMDANWDRMGGETFRCGELRVGGGRYFSLGYTLAGYRVLHVVYVEENGICSVEVVEIVGMEKPAREGHLARWIAGPIPEQLEAGLLVDLSALTEVCRYNHGIRVRKVLIKAALEKARDRFEIRDDIAGQVLDIATEKSKGFSSKEDGLERLLKGREPINIWKLSQKRR